MAPTDGGYRSRDVLLFGAGLMFFGSYLGQIFWGWAPFVMAALTGGIIGVLVGDWNDGGGDGGLAVALGGIIFVLFLNYQLPLETLFKQVLLSFVMFAFLGMITGAISGFIHQQATQPDVDPDAEDAEDPATG